MSEEVLKLQVGEKVQLQRISAEASERYLVTVIGYLPGQTLLVTAPVVNDKVQFIRDGQRFAVRMLEGSRVWGFMSTVQHMISNPFPYLHLSYPNEVESIAVRNAERVSIALSALVRNTRDPDEPASWQPVMIRDLSASGGCLESIDQLGEQAAMLELRFRVAVCGREESLRLVGKVRNSARGEDGGDAQNGRFSTGIEFYMLNRFQEIMLSNYILEHRLGRE